MLTRFVKIVLFIAVFMLTAGLGTYFTVHLLIRSEETVVVPALIGKEVVYALEVLTDLGLNTKVKGSEFSPDVPKHHIIDQAPLPGSEIKQGRDVRLVISKGARTVIMPNLAGMRLPMANILIAENDLHPGNKSYTFHSTPRDQILSQFPPPGKVGLRGDTIALLISAGPTPRWMRMADLKGMSLDQAIDVIEDQQLVLGTISQIDDPGITDDTVTRHSPADGHPVLPASAVNLTINRRVARTTTARRNDATIFRYRAPQGFLRQHVQVRISRIDGSFNLLDQFVKPGHEIWLLILRDVPTTLFIYIDGDLTKTVYYQ